MLYLRARFTGSVRHPPGSGTSLARKDPGSLRPQVPFPPLAQDCPESAAIEKKLVALGCQQSDALVVQSKFANTLRIISGTGAFSELSPAEKSLRVTPGQVLVGTVTPAAHNGFPSDAVTPLIWTPSWGSHRTSWRLINRWIPVGDSLYVASLNLSAPEASGTYFIAFAFNGELTGAQVASATNWATRRVVWDDCNDIAQLGAAQIAEAQKCGFTIDNRLLTDGYKLSYLPMDAVYISALTSGE